MTQDLATILESITARIGTQPTEPAAALEALGPDPIEAARVAALERQIPKAFRWARSAAPELAVLLGQPVANLVARMLSAPRVVIVGPSSAGKTSLACAALRACLEARDRDVGFISAFRLSTARMRAPLGHEAPDVVRALEVRRLFLDELGGELGTPTSAVAEVIYDRHLEGMWSCITTPFEHEEIHRRYGEGIARRVFGDRALVVRLGKKP